MFLGLCPWSDLWPKAKPGHSPGIMLLLSAGHSHRRTSGGKAVISPTEDLYAKFSQASVSGGSAIEVLFVPSP
jgi:hypothetical protein